MKRFLKFSILLVSVLCIFSACADDDDEEDYVVAFSTLPISAQSFMTTYFSESSVTQAKQYYVPQADGTYYKVYATGGFEIKFDKPGNWLDIDAGVSVVPASIFASSPALTAIKSYVTTNHATLNIVELEKKATGYKIELSNDLDLYFDAEGKYLRQEK